MKKKHISNESHHTPNPNRVEYQLLHNAMQQNPLHTLISFTYIQLQSYIIQLTMYLGFGGVKKLMDYKNTIKTLWNRNTLVLTYHIRNDTFQMINHDLCNYFLLNIAATNRKQVGHVPWIVNLRQ